jgi:SAM-dependent methyltransferase
VNRAPVQQLDDPRYVAEQYATECGLAARKAIYADISGPDARDVALQAVLEQKPVAVLEVGCGEGELAEQLAASPGISVVAVDLSPRMVELTAARGVDARVADVQALPFADESFDVVVAVWMLYHVPDLDRGLDEIVRVLRPGGVLVAGTNAPGHLAEVLALAGLSGWELGFDGENGQPRLEAHFARVERREAYGMVTLADIDAVRSYYGSSQRLQPYASALPLTLEEPLVAKRLPVVFVAGKAS